MATINVYDRDSGLTKTVTIDISQATVSGSGSGKASFYVTISTSAKDTEGGTVPPIILTDTDFADDITETIKASLIELFTVITGAYLSSSSSSDLVSWSSKTGDGISSQSSESSVSTRFALRSSSSSSDSSSQSSQSVSSGSSRSDI